MTKKKDNSYIDDFMKAVYGEFSDLAASTKTSEKVLKDATQKIKDLEEELRELKSGCRS